jgi:hypothetical protein
LTAEKLRNIFAHFVELEVRKDCEARRAEHGDTADQHPLPRCDAQRRFDALVAIFERAYVASGDGKVPDPVVNILCDQRTLHDLLGRAGIALADGGMLDLDELTKAQIDAVLAEFVNDPTAMLSRLCETSSGQQIAPQLLIRALLTAQVRRVVLDANSTVIDLGERKRLFTGNARIAATLLQQFCQHPGCEVPAARCQIDHNHEHHEGGRTALGNLAHLCVRHHTLKSETPWTIHQRPDGTLEFHSPLGNTYEDPPPPRVMFVPTGDPPPF